MGHRANLVVVDRDGWRLYYSHWAANGVYRQIAAGPDAALAFVRAQGEVVEWLDDVWAEGGLVVDTVERRLVWYGNDTMVELPRRRVFSQLLAETWPGWRIDWAYDGLGDIAAYVGVERAVVRNVDVEELTRPPSTPYDLDDLVLADDVPVPVNVQGSYALLTVRTGDAVRTWVLSHEFKGHLAWRGPGLLDLTPGPGYDRVRLAELPDTGLHVDVTARTVGAWAVDQCPGLAAEIDARWPGWTVEFWHDGYERQVAAAGDTVVLPAAWQHTDVSPGTDELRSLETALARVASSL